MTAAASSRSSRGEVPSTWPPPGLRRHQPHSRLHGATTVPAHPPAPLVPRPEPLPLFPPPDESAAASAAPPTEPAPASIVDLRTAAPPPGGGYPDDAGARFGLGRRWGIAWDEAAQGWIGRDTPNPVWRPIVATTGSLPQWDIDTYLGVVTAEVALESSGSDVRRLGETLARARSVGLAGLTEEAVERGAHAVLGVTISYTPLEGRLLLTITGTAVTLRERG
jgi:uncharacterized protein YbjQ (UPF0145 family)